MLDKPKVGDVIQVLPEHGRYYYKRVVVDETPRSWVLLDEKYAVGYRKNNGWYGRIVTKMPKSLKGWKIGTQLDADRLKWVNENQYRVSELVRYTFDPDKLIAIAKIYGHPIPSEIERQDGKAE